jgi:hypothetical protein
MVEKSKPRKFKGLTKRQRTLILPLFVVIGTGAIVLAVLAIIVMPRTTNDNQRGIGADGFQAYQETGTDLGIGKVVSKSDVVAALGVNAKSVSDADVSKVFNYNGDRGQTLTFNFKRADNNQASLYIDVVLFKNSASLTNTNIYNGTGKAGTINGLSAYYMHAQTLGTIREYRLLVVNGLKAYKFVIDQPYKNITISEVSALAALKKLALKAQL